MAAALPQLPHGEVTDASSTQPSRRMRVIELDSADIALRRTNVPRHRGSCTDTEYRAVSLLVDAGSSDWHGPAPAMGNLFSAADFQESCLRSPTCACPRRR